MKVMSSNTLRGMAIITLFIDILVSRIFNLEKISIFLKKNKSHLFSGNPGTLRS